MSNYEGKLGEWLKYVQQQVDSVGKKDEKEEAKQEPQSESRAGETAVEWPKPEDVVIRDRMGRVPVDPTEVVDDRILADPSFLEDRPDILDRGSSLFDEADIPDVEEYLPFLREPEPEPEQPAEPETKDQRLLFLPEGTGEPKPIMRRPEEQAPEPPAPVAEAPALDAAPTVETEPKAQPRQQRVEVAPPVASNLEEVRTAWDKLPRHIQLLVGHQPKEVAQKSYKKFPETREQLVERLLDPTLSLEETARILNVCPTTVRRYTNRGALQHFRTAGNQRRFRLSDVLAFLESSTLPGMNSQEQTSEPMEQ